MVHAAPEPGQLLLPPAARGIVWLQFIDTVAESPADIYPGVGRPLSFRSGRHRVAAGIAVLPCGARQSDLADSASKNEKGNATRLESCVPISATLRSSPARRRPGRRRPPGAAPPLPDYQRVPTSIRPRQQRSTEQGILTTSSHIILPGRPEQPNTDRGDAARADDDGHCTVSPPFIEPMPIQVTWSIVSETKATEPSALMV